MLRRSGRSGRVAARAPLALAGPAFVAAVAYVDPGNFATNTAAGAEYGYQLVWVVVLANLMAVPVQYLSAKVGIVTGRSLPAVSRDRFGRRGRVVLWLQAEVVAMATDVAEFLGAAVGLNLLFGIGLLPAGVITAVVSFGVLALQRRGHRPFEVAISAFLGFIVVAFVYQLVRVGLDLPAVAGGLLPTFPDSGALVLAVGIVGATVMPHAVYVHSALAATRVKGKAAEDRERLLRFQKVDVVAALALAGLVNLAILLVAARVFAVPGREGSAADLEGVHAGLGTYVGGGAALVFAAALLASGLSSSSVGTYAGQVVMEGFVNIRLPVWIRRTVTMLPALILLTLGVSPTAALVGSQVVLSFGIPFALFALLRVTRDRGLLGEHVNGRAASAVLMVISAIVVALNVVLIVDQFVG